MTNPQAQAQALIAQLHRVPSYPWPHIQVWGMFAAPTIERIAPELFARFVELTQEPLCPSALTTFLGGTRKEYEQFVQVSEEQRINVVRPICEQRKADIMAFLSTLQFEEISPA